MCKTDSSFASGSFAGVFQRDYIKLTDCDVDSIASGMPAQVV